MGALLARLRRKQTTTEILEGINKDINRLQKNRKENQERLKKIVTRLIICSIIAYIIGAIVFFFLYLPETWPLRLLFSLPLLIFPVLIWGLKKLLHWYFVKRIASNDLALRELREKKKQILEDVTETETYKKAKEILEKFDPERFRKLEVSQSGSHMTEQGTSGTDLRQRTVPAVQQQGQYSAQQLPVRSQTPISRPPVMTTPRFSQPTRPRGPFRPPTPAPTDSQRSGAGPRPRMPMAPQTNGRGGPMMPGTFVPPPGPPMPRSVLPRERGTMDRLMDYLVGDGPENRYALICRQCHSHNGMALKEEFEYMSFRCCYCFYLNPARKQRPLAPKLEFFAPRPAQFQGQGSNENSEESNDDDDEVDDESKEDDSATEMHQSSNVPKPSTGPVSSVQDGTKQGQPASKHDGNQRVDDLQKAHLARAVQSPSATQVHQKVGLTGSSVEKVSSTSGVLPKSKIPEGKAIGRSLHTEKGKMSESSGMKPGVSGVASSFQNEKGENESSVSKSRIPKPLGPQQSQGDISDDSVASSVLSPTSVTSQITEPAKATPTVPPVPEKSEGNSCGKAVKPTEHGEQMPHLDKGESLSEQAQNTQSRSNDSLLKEENTASIENTHDVLDNKTTERDLGATEGRDEGEVDKLLQSGTSTT